MDPAEKLLRAEAKAVESPKPQKREKPLKPYRSHAERVALKQRNIQIALTATNVLVACLTCLKVFGIL